MQQLRRIHHYADVQAMQQAVVEQIQLLASACIEQQGSFHIILTGGNTPQPIYRALRDSDTDWSAWHIYMGDERCLPEGDAQRNDHMANQSWLSHVPVPGDQLYMIPAQLGAEAGAEHYDAVIRAIDEFDLVLLGLGEDGHTASLFPGQAYDETASVVAVHDAPKPPEDRISLTAAALGKAKHAWFLVSGEGKRTAMQQWLQGDAIPASTIRPDSGIDIHTDIDLDPAGA